MPSFALHRVTTHLASVLPICLVVAGSNSNAGERPSALHSGNVRPKVLHAASPKPCTRCLQKKQAPFRSIAARCRFAAVTSAHRSGLV